METVVAVFASILGTLVLNLVTAVPAGIALMWLAEFMHGNVAAAIPALGFATCYVIALLFGWFFAWVSPNASTSS